MALEEGVRAPEVDWVRWNRDQLAVLAFFKAECPTCQLTFPYLERVYRVSLSDQVVFAAISQDDEAETRQFQSTYKFSFPCYCEAEPYEVSERFRVEFVPTIYCVDGRGIILQSMEGFSKHGLQQLAGHLTRAAGRPVTPIFRPDDGVPAYRPG